MILFYWLRSFTRNVLGRTRAEEALADEIACHVELLVASNMDAGFDHAEARRKALMELGGIEQVKEKVREQRAGYFFDTLRHDAQRALKFLLTHRSFSATAALTLAPAFAAAIVVFSVARVGFVHPLNYPDADHLLQISVTCPVPELAQADVSVPRFEFIRSAQNLINVAGCVGEPLPATVIGQTEQINVAHVSSSFFELLNARPLHGRLFTASESDSDRSNVVILGYHHWQKRFGGDSAIIGRHFMVDGVPSTVVGILPERFESPFGRFDAFLPRITGVRFLGPDQIQRGAGFLKVIARPKEGVRFEQINSALTRIDREYREQASENMDAYAVSNVVPLRETVVRSTRPTFYALIVGSGC